MPNTRRASSIKHQRVSISFFVGRTETSIDIWHTFEFRWFAFTATTTEDVNVLTIYAMGEAGL